MDDSYTSTNRPDAAIAAHGPPLVELRGVSRQYGDGPPALSNIDLVLHRGESVAIIGRSGSGKSTLLNLLGLLDVPSDGEVLIDGHRTDDDSDKMRSRRRASDLGFVFQRAHLIGELSARENVLLGLRYAEASEDVSGRRTDDALAAVGLENKVHSIARTLSGGEMQRVAIARTLARPAPLWLADEPTGNLDSAHSAEIIDLLKKNAARRGACLVVVTHEPEIAARLDRVITLHDGRIVDDTGTSKAAAPDELAQREMTASSELEKPPTSPGSWMRRARRTSRFVWQGVSAHPRRAWSGVLAAAVAVSLALSALGLAQSAAAQVTSVFDAQRATQVTAHLTAGSDNPARWPIRVATVASFPGVTAVEYWQTFDDTPLANGAVAKSQSPVVAIDVEPSSATETQITWATSDDHHLGPGEVLLGTALAKQLGIAQLDVAPEITINSIPHRVVGLITNSRAPTALGSAFLTDPNAAALPASVTSLLFVKTEPGAARNLADRLRSLADPYGTTQMEIDPVLTPDSFRDTLENNVSTSLQLLAIVAGLAGLIAVVFVNILSVGSRTAEFGVRRAFGARRSELVSLVAGESTLLGLLGAILGLGVGFLAIMTVTALAHWQPVFDLRLLFIPLTGALLFGTLGGLPPAVIAGRIQPADAVRT